MNENVSGSSLVEAMPNKAKLKLRTRYMRTTNLSFHNSSFALSTIRFALGREAPSKTLA